MSVKIFLFFFSFSKYVQFVSERAACSEIEKNSIVGWVAL